MYDIYSLIIYLECLKKSIVKLSVTCRESVAYYPT